MRSFIHVITSHPQPEINGDRSVSAKPRARSSRRRLSGLRNR